MADEQVINLKTNTNMEEEKKPLNLNQKIVAIMATVERVQKDGTVGSGSYAYNVVTEEKLTAIVREQLVHHSLTILPVGVELFGETRQYQDTKIDKHTKQTYMVNKFTRYVEVINQWKIIDADTGESELLSSFGGGVDEQDKATGKASTYSYKDLLVRLFKITRGDDPDKIHSKDFSDKVEGNGVPLITEEKYRSALKALEEGKITKEALKAALAKYGDNLYKEELTKKVG